MSRDEFKRRILGYWGRSFHSGMGSSRGGVCSCCRETTKREATRLARRRLKRADNKLFKLEGK